MTRQKVNLSVPINESYFTVREIHSKNSKYLEFIEFLYAREWTIRSFDRLNIFLKIYLENFYTRIELKERGFTYKEVYEIFESPLENSMGEIEISKEIEAHLVPLQKQYFLNKEDILGILGLDLKKPSKFVLSEFPYQTKLEKDLGIPVFDLNTLQMEELEWDVTHN